MDFCGELANHIAEGDFDKTGAFVNARQYATKMRGFISKEVIIKEVSDNTAVNILKQIDRVSKHFPRFREDYDDLSERVHPNGQHSIIFGSQVTISSIFRTAWIRTRSYAASLRLDICLLGWNME